MAAWGIACTTWDDSVDEAKLAAFSWGEIPEDRAVMTTWHEKDSLEEAYFFATNAAFHPSRPLGFALIVDISKVDREAQMPEMWSHA